jgi:hypothetical protein
MGCLAYEEDTRSGFWSFDFLRDDEAGAESGEQGSVVVRWEHEFEPADSLLREGGQVSVRVRGPLFWELVRLVELGRVCDWLCI